MRVWSADGSGYPSTLKNKTVTEWDLFQDYKGGSTHTDKRKSQEQNKRKNFSKISVTSTDLEKVFDKIKWTSLIRTHNKLEWGFNFLTPITVNYWKSKI